jgi:hypothetical protein
MNYFSTSAKKMQVLFIKKSPVFNTFSCDICQKTNGLPHTDRLFFGNGIRNEFM